LHTLSILLPRFFTQVHISYNNATTPAAKAKAPGILYISAPDLAVAEAEAEAVPDMVLVAVGPALDTDDPEPADVAEPAEDEAEFEEAGAAALKVPPVPMETVGCTTVAFDATLI
jgi:hypothetical protein